MTTRKKWVLASLAITGIGLYAFAPCYLPGDDTPPHIEARAIWINRAENESSYAVGTMDVDSRTTAEGLEFAGGGDAHVPGFIGVVDRIVEYLEKGRVVYHDKIIVMDDDAKVVYNVPLAIAAQNYELAFTRDAKR
jgi:hypothetical protein